MITTTSVGATTRLTQAAIIAAASVLAFPAFSFAAMYAYVNQAGEVRTVEANDPNTAISTAPSIDEHSGVMLLTNPSDGIVGDSVPGV